MNPRIHLALIVLIVAALACGSGTPSTSVPVVRTATPAGGTSGDETAAPTDEANTPEAEETTEPTEEPEPEDQETFLGDTVEMDGYFIWVETLEDPATPSAFYSGEAGKKLVAVEVVLGNQSDRALNVNPLNATLLDSEGFTYQAELASRDGQITTVDLDTGERARGWIGFSVPEDAVPARLKYMPGGMFGGDSLQVGLLPPPDGHEPITVDTEREAPDLASLGDAVEVDGYTLTAVTVEDPATPGMLYQPQEGMRLVAVEIVVGNETSEKLGVNPLYVYLVDTDGFVYTAELGGRDGQIDTIDLAQGEKAKGWVAFQVPEDAELESIKFSPLFSDLSIQTGLSQ